MNKIKNLICIIYIRCIKWELQVLKNGESDEWDIYLRLKLFFAIIIHSKVPLTKEKPKKEGIKEFFNFFYGRGGNALKGEVSPSE